MWPSKDQDSDPEMYYCCMLHTAANNTHSLQGILQTSQNCSSETIDRLQKTRNWHESLETREHWDRVSWETLEHNVTCSSLKSCKTAPLKWPRYPECTDLRALTRVRRRSRYWECCAACFDTKQMISPWCLQQMIIHNPCVSINIMGLSQVVMSCKYESKVTGRLCSHSSTIR